MAIPGRINATKHAPNGDEVVPLELPEFDMFSTRKPRNLIAGTSSGLKSVVKGVVGGTVGLIATPIVRAHQVVDAGVADNVGEEPPVHRAGEHRLRVEARGGVDEGEVGTAAAAGDGGDEGAVAVRL